MPKYHEDITDYQRLENLLKEENSKVIVMCSTSWCGPCKLIKPQLKTLAENIDNRDIDFVYIDCQQFSDPDERLLNFVKGYPTFFSFHKGLINNTFVGANLIKLQQMTQVLRGGVTNPP